MGRRASRETAMKLLYQLEIQKEDRDEQVKNYIEENETSKKDQEYIMDVVKGVYENVNDIDTKIELYSKGWKINRISKVDLSVLRLSIYEICYRDDIPFNVSVNEAVELAKKYSGEEAGAFVNGVLSKMKQTDDIEEEKD